MILDPIPEENKKQNWNPIKKFLNPQNIYCKNLLKDLDFSTKVRIFASQNLNDTLCWFWSIIETNKTIPINIIKKLLGKSQLQKLGVFIIELIK